MSLVVQQFPHIVATNFKKSNKILEDDRENRNTQDGLYNKYQNEIKYVLRLTQLSCYFIISNVGN
jgi:hypothetical protein